MKKAGLFILPLLCFTFLAFLTGFYLGRNLNRSPIRLSGVSDAFVSQNSTTVAPTSTQETAPELIHINTATKEQLETLPGIGPKLAQRILDYIQENGPFETLSQLTLVSGIGPEKLNDIMDFATVGG